MLTTPTIKIFYQVGKSIAIKAKGAAALALATGLGAAVVTAAKNISDATKKAQDWLNSKIYE